MMPTCRWQPALEVLRGQSGHLYSSAQSKKTIQRARVARAQHNVGNASWGSLGRSNRLVHLPSAWVVALKCSCATSTSHSSGTRGQTTQRPTKRQPLDIEGGQDVSRRGLIAAAILGVSLAVSQHPSAWAATDQRLLDAFRKAMQASDSEAADQAWTEAIKLAPDNAPALSNRGTIRLQAGRWQDARSDVQRALELEGSDAQGRAAELNNLGNAEGALGDWDSAKGHFEAAAEDPGMESIAKANLTLALWEMGDDAGAIRSARQLVRRDGAFLDMRCALAAFLHATGSTAEAEGQWDELQNGNDGLGSFLYGRTGAVACVRGRWPPRATAALQAFLALSDTASARGYDGSVRQYRFAALGKSV